MIFFRIISVIVLVLSLGLLTYTSYTGYDNFVRFISNYSGYADTSGIKEFFSEGKFTIFKIVLGIGVLVGLLLLIFANRLSQTTNKIGNAISTTFQDISTAYQGMNTFTKGTFWGILFLNILVKIYYATSIPINHDEAMGYGLFASRGLLVSMSYYYTNNHILHHVLVNLCAWLPLDMVLKIRIPTLISNFLAVAAFFFIFKKYFNTQITSLLTVIFSFVFPILYYGYLSRGYSLVFISVLLMFYAALGILSQKPQLKHFVLLTIGGIVGLYAHPTFIYPAFAINILLFFYVLSQKDIELIKSLVFSGMTVGVAIILLYSPVLIFSGPDKLFGNAWTTQPITRLDVLNGLYGEFSAAFQLIFSSQYSILFALPVAALGMHLAKFSKVAVFSFLLILINPLVLLLQSLLVFDRYWIFLVVPTLFLFGHVLKSIKPLKKIMTNVVTIVVCGVLSIFLIWKFDKRVQYEELFSMYSKTISEYLVDNNCEKVYVTHLHGVAIPRYYFIINDKKVYLDHVPTDEDISPATVKDYDFVLAKYELKSLDGTYEKVFDFSTDHRTWENAILYQKIDRQTSSK